MGCVRSLAGAPEELAGADPNPCSRTLSHFTSQQLMALLQPDTPFPVISCFSWACGHQREASRERPTLPLCRWSCVPCAGWRWALHAWLSRHSVEVSRPGRRSSTLGSRGQRCLVPGPLGSASHSGLCEKLEKSPTGWLCSSLS